MKHSYLILAHNDVPLLQALVSCLDDDRNDIYVHWDLKSGPIPEIATAKSGLCFIEDRVNVNWGAYSMVVAEYNLFKAACKNGPYQYYHLLSGADLPIKSQDYIHQVCDDSGNTEFIAFAEATESELDYRVQHFFLFQDSFKGAGFIKRVLRKAFVKVQDLFKYHRTDVSVRKGSQWCSVTQAFVDYILSKEDEVKKVFSHTFCPDELFIQTLCANSPFYERVKEAESEFDGNLRYIKWTDGALLPITMDDIPLLRSSDRWFARKFSGRDKDLVDAVIIMSND